MGTSRGSKQRRSYAIVGAGALGGFYGACLQRVGLEAHFLLHRDYEHVRQHGLRIESPQGDFTLSHVYAYSQAQDVPRCDVVVVALKTTQNQLLPKILPSVVKDDGVVLVLQNGFGIEAEIAQIVGAERVMGGLCFICSNKIGPGHIRHLDYGAITLGEYAPQGKGNGISDRLQQIAHDFEAAGITIHLAEDLQLARWEKLVWNIPFNGLSVVLDATTNQLMADVHARALVEQLMWEVVTAAAACGCSISNSIVQKMLDYTLKMKPYRTSMKIDYDAQRPLEVEAIFGNPLRAAQRAGTHLPLLAMLYWQLKFLDRSR